MGQEKQQTSQETQAEKFKKSLSEMLADSKIDRKEAQELLKSFDLEKEEIIQVVIAKLATLRLQFGEEFEAQNFKNTLQELLKYSLDTQVTDKDLLYRGIGDYIAFSDSEKYSIDLKKTQKPEKIDNDNWQNAQELLNLAKDLGINDGRITFTKEGKTILELDTFGSDLYLTLDNGKITITGQEAGKIFTQEVSKEDLSKFVSNYSKTETLRVLEQMGFTGGLTLGGVLSFSIRTGIGLLLGAIGTGLGAYKGVELVRGYSLSYNEAVSVFRENKDNPELIKSYLHLSQIGYITGYSSGVFETIDGEKLSKDDLSKKEIESDEVSKYQLLKGLKNNSYNPKKVGENQYELDMNGLFDKTNLSFENGKINFSTSVYEDAKVFNFSSVEEAFLKIQKINEIVLLEMQIKNLNNQYDFSDNNNSLKKKILYLKKEL